MRSLLAGLTTRGRAFLAAGAAAAAVGLDLGQRTLLSIGGLLVVLPLLSVLVASRARCRVRCAREITPARVPAGQAALVCLRVDNTSRLPTGLLLAEDTVPYSLGARPRFVLDRIEPGGTRTVTYPVQCDHRGRYAIGPLHVQVADTFGLARLGSQAADPGTLMVTPAITPLQRAPFAGTWLGDGGSRAGTAATAGEDDVVPRAYRDGDDLRRVHWRSTARYGELMVRREERHWRNRVALFLDTRGSGHAGRGPASSFEFAVSAAASIGVHLADEGVEGDFITDQGQVTSPGRFEDVLLDALAVIGQSRALSLSPGLAQIPGGSNGLLVAIVGRLPADQARLLAASRRTAGPAMALVLDVATWSAPQMGRRDSGEAELTAGILASAGWRVATVSSDMSLRAAWESLDHAGQPTGHEAAALRLAGTAPADRPPADPVPGRAADDGAAAAVSR
jgi:uncharacterized protein (DUF58 family)